MLVSQIAERLSQSPVEIQVADILRPEVLEERERGRRSLYPQPFAANSGDGSRPEDADWNPLDYRLGR